MWDFYVLTGFENVVSKIELDRSSLARHQTLNPTFEVILQHY